MADESKIEKLQRAVQDDPNDELAQFSLGSALLEAGRAAEAGPCFQRVLAVNSHNSKAYQLLADVQLATGFRDLAVETLTNGYRVAHRKGDMMPMRAMAEKLTALGAPVPDLDKKPAAATASVGESGFSCRRCGSNGPALKARPFKGPLGEKILASICERCWKEWVGMGTKVINELRLPMFDPQAQEMYDKHMKDFLLLD